MADFAEWATACETAYGWAEGTFLTAYEQNRGDAVQASLEADLVATAVQTFMENLPQDQKPWTGISAKLLELLNIQEGDRKTSRKGWPTSPRGLSGCLRVATPTLREVGIDVTFSRRRKITLAETPSMEPTVPTVTSVQKIMISVT